VLNALVAYTDNDTTVWPSNDVQKAIKNILHNDISISEIKEQSSYIQASASQAGMKLVPNICKYQGPLRPGLTDGFNALDTCLRFVRAYR